MFLRRLSIQWKITLLAGLCLLGVVALLVGLSVYRMQHSSVLVKSASTQMLDESARLRLEARGELQALRIQRYFMDAFQYGKGFSRQILFLRDQAQKRFLDAYDLREDLTRQVRTALAANPEVLGLYVVFEPNALDGKDELFVDQPALGSNDKGRFSLYWAQATPGQLESESMVESELADTSSGPSGAAYNAWYTCPKESAQPCVLDPYFDKVGERQLLMTSIAFPLELDGKVIGVMGLDINLSNLQALSEQGNRELYDGVGQVGILSRPGCSPATAATPACSARTWPRRIRSTPANSCNCWPPARAGCSTRTTTSRCCNRCSRFPAPSPGACSSKCRRAPSSARPWRWNGNWTTCVAKAPGSNWASASAPRCSACWCCG
ncbi:hypothetical protein ACET4L_01780 [Pseudomonas aeruginosa]